MPSLPDSLHPSSQRAATVPESGPFHRLVRRDSDTLLAVFAAWNTPADRFRPYRAVLPLPYALLFLNAPDNSWYLGGIPGLGPTAAAAADGVARLSAASGCRRLVTFGASMGGFGALALGLELGADVIIAHGGESIVGLPGSRSARGIRDSSLIHSGRARVRGWRSRAARHNGAIHCFYGETDIQDPLHAAYLRKLTGVASVPVSGASHDVSRFVAERYGLARHIREIVDGEADRFAAAFATEAPPIGEVAQVYRRRTLGRAPDRCPLPRDAVWVGTHMLRLVEALATENGRALVDVATTAVRARPDFAYFHYALVAVLLGLADERVGGNWPLKVAVRPSYLPKPLTGTAARRLAPADAVFDYHAYLIETLAEAGRLTDGVAAADEAVRLVGGVPALAELRERLARTAGEAGI